VDVERLESLVGRDLSSWKVARWERASAATMSLDDLAAAAPHR